MPKKLTEKPKLTAETAQARIEELRACAVGHALITSAERRSFANGYAMACREAGILK